MYLRIFSLAVLTVSQLGSTASAQLSNFFEDFEGLNLTMMNQRLRILPVFILGAFLTPAFMPTTFMPPADGQVLLNEQFNGTSVDTNIFTFSGTGDESFFGRTQLNSPELAGPAGSPEVSDGTLKLRLQTYNPFGSAAGNLFLADEIRTIQTFAPTPTSGISYEIRARFVDDATNPLSPGLVGGLFSFGVDADFPNRFERDEIDFELLSNTPQGSLLTNVFDDQNFVSSGNFLVVSVPNYDSTEFNDYRIDVNTDSIRFFVNGVLVREELSTLAIEPQDFRLNINAPDPSFNIAFSNALQPTAFAALNETFILEVDSLVISGPDSEIPSDQLSNFFDDFEGLNRDDPNALANAGWNGAAAGITPSGGLQFFANFSAPNNIDSPQLSVISDSSSGSPPAGNQGLVVFSDYNSDIHSGNPAFESLIISIFQQRTISAADIGNTIEFSWVADGNALPPTGDTLTEAFLLTLDPNNNFNTTNQLDFDTTTTADGALAINSLTLDLSDPLLEGQILQFGFRNTANSFNGSAVDYDNVALTVISPPSCLVGDVNMDDVVDFLDIAPFISALSSGPFQCEADINEDGSVSFLDISPFIQILSGS